MLGGEGGLLKELEEGALREDDVGTVPIEHAYKESQVRPRHFAAEREGAPSWAGQSRSLEGSTTVDGVNLSGSSQEAMNEGCGIREKLTYEGLPLMLNLTKASVAYEGGCRSRIEDGFLEPRTNIDVNARGVSSRSQLMI